MSDKPLSDAAIETVAITTSGDPGEAKAVTQPATTPVAPKITVPPRKPEQRRVRMLAEDPDLSAEIYELQGSYGFPRDKKRDIRKMTLEEGPKWLEEARALKATNLKEMDEKLQKRVVEAVASVMQPALKLLSERLDAHAEVLKDLGATQSKTSTEGKVELAPLSANKEKGVDSSGPEVKSEEVPIPVWQIVVAVVVIAIIGIWVVYS